MASFSEQAKSFFYSLLQNAARRKVDEVATSLAVRQAIVRVQIRLLLEQYEVRRGLDHDRATGFGQRIFEDLAQRFNLNCVDPESEPMREAITMAVTLRAVELPSWVVLDQLRQCEKFDPRANIRVAFRDSRGSRHHSDRRILSLLEEFLFHRPFAFSDDVARLDPTVSRMIEERLRNESLTVLEAQMYYGDIVL